jgi:hypothetical protein
LGSWRLLVFETANFGVEFLMISKKRKGVGLIHAVILKITYAAKLHDWLCDKMGFAQFVRTQG